MTATENAEEHGGRRWRFLATAGGESSSGEWEKGSRRVVESAAGMLNKFIRYEAHIDRMLSRSVRDLERVQEKRKRVESIINRDLQDPDKSGLDGE